MAAKKGKIQNAIVWVTIAVELFSVLSALLYAEHRLTSVETTLNIFVQQNNKQLTSIEKIASEVRKIDTLDLRIRQCEKSLRSQIRKPEGNGKIVYKQFKIKEVKDEQTRHRIGG